MRAEMRDVFVDNLDATARELGARDFQQGIEISIRALKVLSAMVQAVETREQLLQHLDALEIPSEWEGLLVQAAASGPQILRCLAAWLNRSATESLPALPSRGPAVSGRKQKEILQYINTLNFELDLPLQVAKKRTAQRFGCSVRTVERLWTKKSKILANGPQYNFNELIIELQRALEADGSPWIPKITSTRVIAAEECRNRVESPIL